MENKENIEISRYPSVELAYEYVKQSYDWMLNRFDSTNKKIQNLLTFAVTITAAIPLFAKVIFNEIGFNSGWFITAIVVFAALVVIGIIGQRVGVFTLINPKFLYDKFLHYTKYEFKKMVLYWAGEHFRSNKRVLNRKCLFLDIMTGLLLCEIVLVIFWIVTQLDII